MARLDAEAAAAAVRPSRIPTAAEARAYLESLPELWAGTSDAGWRAIAEAVFARIDVLGIEDATVHLTQEASTKLGARGASACRNLDDCPGRTRAVLLHLAEGVADDLRIERPLVHQKRVERLDLDPVLEQVGRSEVGDVASYDRLGASRQRRGDHVPIAGIDRGRNGRQKPTDLRGHRLRESVAHLVEASVDFRSVDPGAKEAVAHLRQDLLTPRGAVHATLGQAQQEVDTDVRMEAVGVE